MGVLPRPAPFNDEDTNEENGMKKQITAIYSNPRDVRRAIDELNAEGFTQDQISVVMSKSTRQHYFPEGEIKSSKMPEGAAAGSVLGVIVGALIAVGSLGVPGGIFVAGPLGAALGGAAAGAVGGGLVGALIGAGVPEDRARSYASQVESGSTLVSVETRDEAEARRAADILDRAAAPSASSARATSTASP